MNYIDARLHPIFQKETNKQIYFMGPNYYVPYFFFKWILVRNLTYNFKSNKNLSTI